MKILYENKIEDATITGSTEAFNYEASSVIDIRTLKTWHTTGCTSENVVFELDAAAEFDSIGIVNHNFTDDAVITIQANATDSWGAPSFEQVLTTWNEYIMFCFFDSTTSYKFWRLLIADTTNTDGFIEIGYISLGNSLYQAHISPTQEMTNNTNSQVEFSTSTNQPFGDPRPNYNNINIEIRMSNNQRKLYDTMFNYCKNCKPVIVGVWEEDFDFEPAYYAVIGSNKLTKKKDKDALFLLNIEFIGVK
jgi:hypothetical protein